ncbi:MAG: hypothetical protein ABIH66_03655 [bacterium]
MTTRQKLLKIIKELPDDVAAQVFDFALFLREKRREEKELRELSRSPAFKRLAGRSLDEIKDGETLSLDEFKEEVKS